MSKNIDLLSLERSELNPDYPVEPTPRADMWIAWNSEDGFTFWDNEKQATLWSADGSIEWPVQYVMQKVQPAPVQERNFCERCGKRLGSGIHTCTPPIVAAPLAAQPDYAWPTIEDYEKEVGFEVNIAFHSAWAMARTTNDLFNQMGSDT